MGAYLLQFSSNDYQESVLGAMNWIEDNLYSEWENIDSYEFRHTSKACLKSKSYLGNDRYWESFKKSYSDLILENQKMMVHDQPRNIFTEIATFSGLH